jgi:hypothetical protein
LSRWDPLLALMEIWIPSKDNSLQQAIADMVCLEPLDGKVSSMLIVCKGVIIILSSAEIISQMIMAELSGKEWIGPGWMPERFLTWNRIHDLKDSLKA